MKAQADTIKALQEQLQHATDALHASHTTNDELHSPLETTTPGIRETPGPHRLLPKGQRQEDKDFQDKVRHQSPDKSTPLSPTDPGMLFIQTLAKAISENHHQDLNDPIKFTGQDQHWDEFYYQLRSYLAAKNWLPTFDHPSSPGTPGFDNNINLKIYNKLTSLCHKGTAITYVRMAAEFDGWGAGRQLTTRYHGFSKQRHRTLRHTFENVGKLVAAHGYG
jgi:hypothetical protein